MGRTLESLRRVEIISSATIKPTPPASPPEECVLDWTMDPAEVPFIEVGGKGKIAAVLPIKHPAHPPKPPYHHVPEKPEPAIVALAEFADVRPMTVSFQAWPAPTQGRGVAREIIAHHQPDHAISQHYAKLAESLLSKETQTTLWTGVRAGVGAATALSNLAVSTARLGLRVVLVDADAGNPRLAAKWGVAPSLGLHQVIAGTAPLEEAVQTTSISKLCLLPALPQAQAEEIPAEAIAWIVRWLRQRFDAIFLRGPSIDGGNLSALAPSSDAVFVVAPKGEPLPVGLASLVARQGGRLQGVLHTQFEQ